MADTSKANVEKAGLAAHKRSKKRGANLLQYYLSGAFAIGVCLLAAVLAIFGTHDDLYDSDEAVARVDTDEPSGPVIPNQIQNIIEGFDFDSDGRISIDEIHMLGSEALKDEKQRAMFSGWKEGFHEADVDGDGYLTPLEVRDLVNKVAMSSMAERFRQASKQAESDSEDGEVEEEGEESGEPLQESQEQGVETSEAVGEGDVSEPEVEKPAEGGKEDSATEA